MPRSKALEAHFAGKWAAQCAKNDRFKPAAEPLPWEPASTDIQKPYVAEVLRCCQDVRIPVPAFELTFFPGRRWRFDVAWTDHKIALEIEGGIWTNGRHTRPQGFIKDMEKYNAATSQGWRVFRCLPGGIAAAIAQVAALMAKAP